MIREADMTIDVPVTDDTPESETYSVLMGDEQLIVEFDGLTGNVIRMLDAPASTATAEEAASYIGRKRMATAAYLAGLEAEKKSRLERITELYDVKINRTRKTLEWLNGGAGYRDTLLEFARVALDGARKRSIQLCDLTLAFRKKAAKIAISDKDVALVYCKGFMPEAIKTTEEVQISRVSETIKALWLADPSLIPASSGFSKDDETDVFEIK